MAPLFPRLPLLAWQATEAGEDIEQAKSTIVRLWESVVDRLPVVGVGLLVLLGFLVCARLTRRVLLAVGGRTRLDPALVILLARLAAAVMVVLGFFVAAVVVFPAFKPGDLIAGLGITSIALGFALKDVLQNFVAGILLLWRRPFRVGDQIRTGTYEGTVERLDVRATRIRTYDDELVVVPNGDVYTAAIVVRTAYGKRRVQMVVGIGYADGIEDARAAILGVLEATEGVEAEPAPMVYVSKFAPSSVDLTVFFWTEAHQANVLRVSDRVATGIKAALDRAGIDIPYPHMVVALQDGAAAQGGAVGERAAGERAGEGLGPPSTRRARRGGSGHVVR